jgi:hypothetical protein
MKQVNLFVLKKKKKIIIRNKFLFKTSSINLDDERKVANEVIYPEIGYFEMARAIDNLKNQRKTTQGSRMSAVWNFACQRND